MTSVIDPGDVAQVRDAFTEDTQRALRVRLFERHESIEQAVVKEHGFPLDAAERLGLLAVANDQVTAQVRIDSLAVDGARAAAWLVSDFLGQRPLPSDHVLGGGGAAATLAGLTVPNEVESALDLGTGGGIQLLHLATHARHLTGTDTNPRALRLAALSLALSGVQSELLLGDRFEPVGDRRFDLIVSNPPMVIGPSSHLEYRDSGLEGDAMSRSVVEGAPSRLTESGTCQLLAHWLHVQGHDWRERVASWLPNEGFDSWVIERELLDPAEYVDLWIDDSGDIGEVGGHEPRGDVRERWLEFFRSRAVESIGMGWITLRRTGGRSGSILLEELRQPVQQPIGPHMRRRLDAIALLDRLDDDALMASVWQVEPDVRLDQRWRSGTQGWEADGQTLVQLEGLRRVAGIDGAGAAVLGAFDGSSPLGAVVDAVATDFALDPWAVREGFAAAIRGLVDAGFVGLVRPPV